MSSIRLAAEEDLPAILAISNWAARHTAANFAVEPERLEDWCKEWLATRREYPWLVAVDGGGEVVVAGTPEEVSKCKQSHTGRYLRRVL